MITNNSNKMYLKPKRDFKATIDKQERSKIINILEVCERMDIEEQCIDIGGMKVKVQYSNGDNYIGESSGRFKFNAQGEYQWNDGYSYKGEFFLSKPYGWGVYKNCLGVERKGYFFRGYLLKSSYGLDQLKDILKEKYMRKNLSWTSRLVADDLRILTDPDVVHGCKLFNHRIRFRRIFEEMEAWKKQFNEDLQSVEAGELDYDYVWSDEVRTKVIVTVMKDCFKEFNKRVEDDNSTHQHSNRSNGSLPYEQKNPKIAKKSKPIEDSEKSLGLKELALTIPKKFDWIKSVDVDKLTEFENQELIEMVKDQNLEGLHLIYKKFLAKNKVFKFLNIKDQKKRNIAMVASHMGHRQIFIDLLTALKRCITIEKLSRKDIQKYLECRDYEGNNIVDLIVIRGFNVKDEEAFATKETEKIWFENNLIKEEENEKDDDAECMMPKFVQGNSIYNTAIKMIIDDERELFKSRFLTYSGLTSDIEKTQGGSGSGEDERSSSENIIFISKRAVALFILFKFCEKVKGIELLKQKDYDEKRNNPLHFSLFKGDLHSTILLLEYKIMMLLWRNGESELPPQVIRWAGENYFRARAIFASILREFTRNFNLKVIDNLLLHDTGVLCLQKNVLSTKMDVDPCTGGLKTGKAVEGGKKDETKKNSDTIVNIMRNTIEQNFTFNKEKVYLYSNNYILVSDELCLQYLKLIRDKSRYRHLKKDHKILKNYTFVQNSELESLQKNFLDYYRGSFVGYHTKDVENFYRESVQEILTWYVFVYGDAEIDPRIYKVLEIDPFDKILDGRNIFHFMSENNSYSLMKDFLDYLYEECHNRPFDETREDYKIWDEETRDLIKLEKLRQKLMIKTRENQQTPAHLCAIHKSIDCFEMLVDFDVDLEEINLRGRTVIEMFDSYHPYNLKSRSTVSPDEISSKILDFFKKDIITNCKQHSLKYKYIKNNRNKNFEKIMTQSKYSLNQDLTRVRDMVIKDSISSIKNLFESMKSILFYSIYLNQASDIDKKDNRGRLIDCKDNLKKLSGSIGKELILPDIITKADISTIAFSLVNMVLGNHTSYITSKQFLMNILSLESIDKIKNFKLTKYERIVKKELYKKLKTLDLSKPLSEDLKQDFTMDQHFCIEVKIKKGEHLHDSVVLEQIDNIKKKYAEYGGGIRIDFFKGYKVDVSLPIVWYNPATYFTCCRKYKAQTWFILIKISDELLNHIATKDQMSTYNFKYNYHTLFYKDAINTDELEPLRHYQKMEIVMNLLIEEFDINRYMKKGLVVKYFPVHDFSKMKLIKDLWSKNKWSIHFKDAFLPQTEKSTLTVLSMITFYHGIQQGFYFGFLSIYNNSMFFLAVVGAIGSILKFFGGISYEKLILVMSLIVGVWSTVFMNMWKRRETELAYSFDALEEENIKKVRNNYRGDPIIDPGLMSISKKNKVSNAKKIAVSNNTP